MRRRLPFREQLDRQGRVGPGRKTSSAPGTPGRAATALQRGRRRRRSGRARSGSCRARWRSTRRRELPRARSRHRRPRPDWPSTGRGEPFERRRARRRRARARARWHTTSAPASTQADAARGPSMINVSSALASCFRTSEAARQGGGPPVAAATAESGAASAAASAARKTSLRIRYCWIGIPSSAATCETWPAIADPRSCASLPRRSASSAVKRLPDCSWS